MNVACFLVDGNRVTAENGGDSTRGGGADPGFFGMVFGGGAGMSGAIARCPVSLLSFSLVVIVLIVADTDNCYFFS